MTSISYYLTEVHYPQWTKKYPSPILKWKLQFPHNTRRHRRFHIPQFQAIQPMKVMCTAFRSEYDLRQLKSITTDNFSLSLAHRLGRISKMNANSIGLQYPNGPIYNESERFFLITTTLRVLCLRNLYQAITLPITIITTTLITSLNV